MDSSELFKKLGIGAIATAAFASLLKVKTLPKKAEVSQHFMRGSAQSEALTENYVNAAEQLATGSITVDGGLLLSPKDGFPGSVEKPTEEDLDKKGITALIEESKLRISNHIKNNLQNLEGADRAFISSYDTDLEIEAMFGNPIFYSALSQYNWDNREFGNELNRLLTYHNDLLEVENNLNPENEGDNSAANVGGEIGDKGDWWGEFLSNLKGKTEAIRGTWDNIGEYTKKLLYEYYEEILYGVAGTALLATGLAVGIKKGKKASLINDEAKSFVGEENFKKFQELSSLNSEIQKTETEINKYNEKARKAKNKAKRQEFLDKANALRRNRNYVENQNKKTRLLMEVNELMNREPTTKQYKALKKYVEKSNEKPFNYFRRTNKRKCGSILRKISRYENKIGINESKLTVIKNNIVDKLKSSDIYKLIQERKDYRAENNFSNKKKKRIQSRLVNSEENQIIKLRKIEDKIADKIKRLKLTGPDKVFINKFINDRELLLTEEKINELKEALAFIRKSNSKLLTNRPVDDYKGIILKYLETKIDHSKEAENRKKILKGIEKIKEEIPNIGLNYFGIKNSQKIEGINIPINSYRSVSCENAFGNRRDIQNFFDALTSQFSPKEDKTYSFTLTYKNSMNEIRSLACSYDNKEGYNLIRSKLIKSLPETAKDIKIFEMSKKINSKNPEKIDNVSYTSYDSLKNSNLYKNADSTVRKFEDGPQILRLPPRPKEETYSEFQKTINNTDRSNNNKESPIGARKPLSAEELAKKHEERMKQMSTPDDKSM